MIKVRVQSRFRVPGQVSSPVFVFLMLLLLSAFLVLAASFFFFGCKTDRLPVRTSEVLRGTPEGHQRTLRGTMWWYLHISFTAAIRLS